MALLPARSSPPVYAAVAPQRPRRPSGPRALPPKRSPVTPAKPDLGDDPGCRSASESSAAESSAAARVQSLWRLADSRDPRRAQGSCSALDPRDSTGRSNRDAEAGRRSPYGRDSPSTIRSTLRPVTLRPSAPSSRNGSAWDVAMRAERPAGGAREEMPDTELPRPGVGWTPLRRLSSTVRSSACLPRSYCSPVQ